MNLANCPTHPDRKLEMICLSDQCPNRFELRCVQCVMASKCRQTHNWKIVDEAIQELFELCETTEVKEEKKGKEKKPVSQATIDQQKQIESAVKLFKAKIEEFVKRIEGKVDEKAKRILSKLNVDVDVYVVVKNILKTCKKDTEPADLSQKLKEISHNIKCGQDGVLSFVEAVQVQNQQDTDFSAFQNELNQLLENLLYIIDEESEMPSQVEDLKKNYESQIDKLLEQVKQIPVFQNRIESLNEKLQAKDAKLKKYEGGLPSTSGYKAPEQSDKKEDYDAEKIKRIQTLIDRRQKMRTSLIQYCQKSPQEQLYMYQLRPNENITKLQIPVTTQTAYILNENVLSVVDQLQFLKYSDSTTGESWIEIPLISTKKQKQQSQSQYQQQQQQQRGGNSRKPGRNFFETLFS